MLSGKARISPGFEIINQNFQFSTIFVLLYWKLLNLKSVILFINYYNNDYNESEAD